MEGKRQGIRAVATAVSGKVSQSRCLPRHYTRRKSKTPCQGLQQRLFRLVQLNPAVLCTSLLPYSFLETTEVAFQIFQRQRRLWSAPIPRHQDTKSPPLNDLRPTYALCIALPHYNPNAQHIPRPPLDLPRWTQCNAKRLWACTVSYRDRRTGGSSTDPDTRCSTMLQLRVAFGLHPLPARGRTAAALASSPLQSDRVPGVVDSPRQARRGI